MKNKNFEKKIFGTFFPFKVVFRAPSVTRMAYGVLGISRFQLKYTQFFLKYQDETHDSVVLGQLPVAESHGIGRPETTHALFWPQHLLRGQRRVQVLYGLKRNKKEICKQGNNKQNKDKFEAKSERTRNWSGLKCSKTCLRWHFADLPVDTQVAEVPGSPFFGKWVPGGIRKWTKIEAPDCRGGPWVVATKSGSGWSKIALPLSPTSSSFIPWNLPLLSSRSQLAKI